MKVRPDPKSATALLSIPKAALRLGIDSRRLRSAVKAGDLEAYRPGGGTCYVHWSDVLRWLRAQRLPSCDHARRRAAEIVLQESRKETAAG